MADLKSSSQLIRQLRSILFKQRFVLFAAGVLLTVAVVATAVIALSLLANVMVLPVWFKVSLLVVTGAASLYFFGRYALARLFTGDVDEVALKLERSHEDLKGRLIAAVQFARMKPHPSY
jgi:cobalamin biosynthesis protein CobD/CbiB